MAKWVEGGGRFLMEVRGESHYQDALRKAAGKQTGQGPVLTRARLVLEDNNRHDRNAVRVEIGGRRVGYIPAEHAPGFRAVAREMGWKDVECPAKIYGGGDRSLGVWLDLPEEFVGKVAAFEPTAAQGQARKRRRGCGCFGAGAVLAVLAVVGAGVLGCFGVKWD